ncbi:MAG: hypothetical protein ABIK12_08590 [Pseudomonadota bacterium]
MKRLLIALALVVALAGLSGCNGFNPLTALNFFESKVAVGLCRIGYRNPTTGAVTKGTSTRTCTEAAKLAKELNALTGSNAYQVEFVSLASEE